MTLTKNSSGVWVAKVESPQGKRTINLRTGDKDEARRIAKESRIAEAELIAKIHLVKKETIAQVVLGRKVKASDALQEWQQWLTTRLSAKQTLNLSIILSAFLREAKVQSEFVHNLTERQLDRWVNNADSTTKASTRAKEVSALRKFFDFCSVRNYVVANPAAELRVDMAILRHEQKETTPGKPFVETQYGKILAGYEFELRSLESKKASTLQYIDWLLGNSKRASVKAFQNRIKQLDAKMAENCFWRVAVQVAWHTGLRFGDICQLEWASLEQPLRLVVWTDKTNARVELRLKPGLSSLLRSLPKLDKVWVFPNQCKVYADVRRRSNFSIEFTRFIVQLGIDGHSFHDFRHAYASRATREGMPLDHVRQRLGHSTAAMTRKYIH